MIRGSHSAARYGDNEEQRHARYDGTAPCAERCKCPRVHCGQQAAEEGMPHGQRTPPCARWRLIAQRMRHALGGDPTRCDLRSNSAPRHVHRRALCDVTPLDLPGAHEGGDNFADRSPPGTAKSHGDPRGTPLCWTSQEPTKVATVSQIAAPQGRRGLTVIPVGHPSAGPPRSPRKWRQLRSSQPPKGRGTLFLICT